MKKCRHILKHLLPGTWLKKMPRDTAIIYEYLLCVLHLKDKGV